MGVMISIIGILAAGLAGLLGLLAFSWLLRPTRERPRSQGQVECGFPAQGDARAIGFNYIGYATLFLVFDLAALYLFLYAIIPSPSAATTLGLFLAIATLGLAILYGTKRRRFYAA
jgi:NADH:ubiquinone oxidoreductase subunit 3 (subunit A)